MKLDHKDYELIQTIIQKGLHSDDDRLAQQAAQLALLDQIRISLHMIYKHGLEINSHNN